MSLFFYRGWTSADLSKVSSISVSRDSTITHTRWGHLALLAASMVVGISLNLLYLAGYRACPRAGREVPHVCLVWLAVRDILVCLILFPTAMDWLIVNLSEWSGGDAWCSIAGFFDFYLNAVYPLLLISLIIVLYSRKLWKPPILPSYPPGPPIHPSSRHSNYSHSRGHPPPALSNSHSHHPSHSAGALQPPSVAGSVQSNRSCQQGGDFRKGFAKKDRGGSRPGSVQGSIHNESRHHTGSIHNESRHHGPGSRPGSVQDKYLAPPARTSSPLGMLQEHHHEGYAASMDGSDLWDAASLDYPGREEGMIEDMDLDFDPHEPELRVWLKWVTLSCWFIALGFGIPGAMNMQTVAGRPPGCYIRSNPFKNAYNYAIDDPGFNFLMANCILTYVIAAIFMIIMAVLLGTVRWTKDGKLNRFIKMCIGLIMVFLITRTPIEIMQFKDLIHSAQGYAYTNLRPDELEYDLLLIWAGLMPSCLNPIVYLFCVSEYRQNIAKSWRIITGKEKSVDEVDEELEIDPDAPTKMTDIM